MKKYLIIPTLLLFSTGLFSQGLLVNGGKMTIESGAYVWVNGTSGNCRAETNITNGAISLNGTLRLDGNYTNNVANADILGTIGPAGQVAFTGTSVQTLGGTSLSPFVFNNLLINNGSGVVISRPSTVNGLLTLMNGLVNTGNNDFIFGPAATVSGTPSAASMIVATGTGLVRKQYTAPGSFLFPVGDNNLTAKYSPVTLNFTTGTFAAGANAGINLVNTPYADPYITGSYLNRYWNVTQTGITGFTCDAAFKYNLADVTGVESNIYCVRINPTPVMVFNQTDSILHQLTAPGLTSFGTFTGALGMKTLNLTFYLEGLYAGAGTMNPAMDFTGTTFAPKWGTAIADQFTLELHSPTAYNTIVASIPSAVLLTNGTATVNIPPTYSGSYYLTINHRNSIETVSAAPVSLAGTSVSYNFSTAASQAYGSNLKNIGGVFAIYSGDVSSAGGIYPAAPVRDGLIDIMDLYYIFPSYLAGSLGYLPSDLNGDGVIDIFDTYIDYTNYLLGIYKMTPP